MIIQRLVLDGFPDGVWACGGCGAHLDEGRFAHPDTCTVIAEARAAERERTRQLAVDHGATYPVRDESYVIVAHPPFADLLGGDPQ